MDLSKTNKCNQKKNKRLNKENVYIIIHHYIYYLQGGQIGNNEVDKITTSQMDKMTISEMDKMTTPIPNNKK